MEALRLAVLWLARAAVWSAATDDFDPDQFRAWASAWDQLGGGP